MEPSTKKWGSVHLCYRGCKDLADAAAIGIIERGPTREVGAPLKLQVESCIGCQACAIACPNGIVRNEDADGQRILHTWNTTAALERCSACGGYFGPEPMAFLKQQVPLSEVPWGHCPKCQRVTTLNRLELSSDF